MEFVPLLALMFLLKKIMDWIRVLIPDDIEPKVLIPAGLLLGVALTLLFSASDVLGGAVPIFTPEGGEEVTLASADVFLVIVFGLFIGAGAGVIHDAVNRSTPPHDN